MITYLRFIMMAHKAYHLCKYGKPCYVGTFNGFGEPDAALLAGIGREAWYITQLAIERKLDA